LARAQDVAADADSPPADSLPADEGEQRARAHFEVGSERFDAGDYPAAAAEFRAAYELSGRPELLFNLYIAHERLGDLGPAAEYLERYLDEGTPAERETALRTRLANLRERQQNEAQEAQSQEAERRRLIAAAAQARADSDPGLAPWLVVGGGAVVAATGLVLLVLAHVDIAAVEDPDGPAPMWADVANAHDRAPILSTLGIILAGVGGAAAVGGLLWAALGGADHDEAEPGAMASDGVAFDGVTLDIGPAHVGVRGVF
jgi:tetratricopeptide (TPR) repeat protein